jgi:hypothetical protein
MGTYRDSVLGTASLVEVWDVGTPEGGAPGLKNSLMAAVKGSPLRSEPSLLPGGEGRSAKFGAGNYFEVAHNALLNLGDTWTLEAWVKMDLGALTNPQNILSKGNGAYYLRLQNVEGGYRAQSLRSQIAELARSSVTLSANTVYHVVATKSGTTRRIWINGVDVTSLQTNSVCGHTTTPLVLGQSDAGFGGVFEGWMQYIAVYSTALSEGTIKAHLAAAEVPVVNATPAVAEAGAPLVVPKIVVPGAAATTTAANASGASPALIAQPPSALATASAPGPAPPVRVVPAARVTSEPVDDALFVELRDSAGNVTRWAGDEPDAFGIPADIATATSAPGGHRDSSCSLSRDPRRTWPDLNLVDEYIVRGRTKPLGRNVFEGQLAHLPSELGDGVRIGVKAIGNQVLLSEDESWKELYVAFGFEGWSEAPFERREWSAEQGRPQGKIPLSTGSGGLSWELPVEALPVNEVTEAHFQAPAGVRIAKLGYRGRRQGGNWANFQAPALLASDTEHEQFGVGAGGEVALTLDNTAHTATLPTPRRYAMLRVFATVAAAPSAGTQQSYDRLAVYGDHGLPLVGGTTSELHGLYAHDVLGHMLETGAPALKFRIAEDGTIVPNTSFVIPHLAFLEGGKVADAIQNLNAYFLNNWAVWDDKTFYWQPWNPDRLTWKARIQGGAHWSPAGRQSETLLNGAIVYFTDGWGKARTAGPVGSGCDFEDPLLEDSDPANPYTRRGRRRWGKLQVDFPLAYGSTAVQVGHVFLLEHRLPQRAGTLVIRPLGPGHVPQIEHPTVGAVPVWALRAGDYVELVGWPEPEPFRVIETDYSHESKTLTAQLDTASSRLSAILERVGVRLVGIV